VSGDLTYKTISKPSISRQLIALGVTTHHVQHIKIVLHYSTATRTWGVTQRLCVESRINTCTAIKQSCSS